MTAPQTIVAGNWKMNLDIAAGVALAASIAGAASAGAASGAAGVNLIVCPPFVALGAVRDAVAGSGVAVGAQNMHAADSGAFTGEIAPPMLVGLCDYVIIGHSERRQFFGETDDAVGRKAAAAWRHGAASHHLRGGDAGAAGERAGGGGHPAAGDGGAVGN